MGIVEQKLNDYIWDNLTQLKSVLSPKVYQALLNAKNQGQENFKDTIELIIDLNNDFFDSVNREYLKNLSIEEVSKQNPKDDYAYSNMGYAYNYKGEYDKAIECYQKAIELNPKNDYAYFGMGVSYSNKKEYDRAIECEQKAIELNPKNANIYYSIGISYNHKEEYDKAIEYCQKAIELNPKSDNVYSFMGNIYDNKGKFDKAIKYYKKAIKLNPKNDRAYYYIGNIYKNRRKFDKAIEYYQKAIELNPKNDRAYCYIGNIYQNRRKFDRAIEYYQKVIELNPKDDYSFDRLDKLMTKFNKALFLDRDFSNLNFKIDALKITKFKQYKSPFKIEFSEQVNIIIGQNAVGKTTLLQAITLGLLKQNSLDAKKVEYEEYISKGESKAELIIYHNDTEKKVEILIDRREIEENFFIPFVLAYGSNFFTSKTNEVKEVAQGIVNHTINKNFTNSIFMDYTNGFVNPIRLLEFLDLEQDDNVPKIQQDFINIINSFLDDFELKAEDKNYFFQKEGYEDRLGLEDLSEGYRGNVLLITDILIKIFGIEKTIDTIEGIILIDEFDKHLHPKWQSKLVNQLTKTFPKIQFIMTTHNPMSILDRNPDEITILNEIDGEIVAVKGRGTKDIGVSVILLEYFNVDTTVSNTMKENIDNFNRLKLKKELTTKEQEELKELEQYLGNTVASNLIYDRKYLKFLEFIRDHKEIDFDRYEKMDEEEMDELLKDFGDFLND